MVAKSSRIGGSVCESNAPSTSETPIAGFEDREDHRTPFASAVVTANAARNCSKLGIPSSCRVKLGPAINQTSLSTTGRSISLAALWLGCTALQPRIRCLMPKYVQNLRSCSQPTPKGTVNRCSVSVTLGSFASEE
jgi:hypothetical protein